MLKKQLQTELKDSMLAKDTERTSTLRLLLSAITYYEIQKGGAGYEATDEDVLAVIGREVKQRNDAIEQFMVAGREELAAKELKEKAILEVYLPEQMTEEDIRRLVEDAVKKTGASTPQDMGKVMGVLMPQVKGKADGGLVSKIVKESLTQT
ncbi:MAG: GatB/YqeY domain-containing protein [bacterium]|nr:GatB/YqeY domain-containing protein [bacterium]